MSVIIVRGDVKTLTADGKMVDLTNPLPVTVAAVVGATPVDINDSVGTPILLGQKVMASSVPVTLASDQSDIMTVGDIIDSDISTVPLNLGVTYTTHVFDLKKSSYLEICGILDANMFVTITQSVDNFITPGDVIVARLVNANILFQRAGLTPTARFVKASFQNVSANATITRLSVIQRAGSPGSTTVTQGPGPAADTQWEAHLTPLDGTQGALVDGTAISNGALFVCGQTRIKSTVTPLAGNATFAFDSTGNFNGQRVVGVTVMVTSDQSGVLKFKGSSPPSGPIRVDLQLPYPGGSRRQVITHHSASTYDHIDYVNDATIQTVFELEAVLNLLVPHNVDEWRFATTTANLAGAGVFTSGVIFGPDSSYRNINVLAGSDVAGTLNIDESDDNFVTTYTTSFALLANVPLRIVDLHRGADYLRLRYVNRASAQGNFLLVGKVSIK